jgi:hypothetical protein
MAVASRDNAEQVEELLQLFRGELELAEKNSGIDRDERPGDRRRTPAGDGVADGNHVSLSPVVAADNKVPITQGMSFGNAETERLRFGGLHP